MTTPHLTKKWQFPRSLTETITYHHTIRKTVSNLNQLLIVHAADNIVNTYKPGSEAFPGFSSIDPEAKAGLFSQVETISDWFPEVASEIDSACEFFLNEE